MGKGLRHLDLFPMSVRVNMAEILLKRYQTTTVSHFADPDLILYLRVDGSDWVMTLDQPLDHSMARSVLWVYIKTLTANRKIDINLDYCLIQINKLIATALKNQ